MSTLSDGNCRGCLAGKSVWLPCRGHVLSNCGTTRNWWSASPCRRVSNTAILRSLGSPSCRNLPPAAACRKSANQDLQDGESTPLINYCAAALLPSTLTEV